MTLATELKEFPQNKKLKRILVSTEGKRTEVEYFERLNVLYDAIIVEPIPRDTKSAPKNVMEAMIQYVDNKNIGNDAIFWLVVDIDKHPSIQFENIQKWCKEHQEYNLAISNPCFELWLILHYEHKTQFKNHKECKSYFNVNYGNAPNVPWFKLITKNHVMRAYDFAKKSDTSDSSGWPIESGCTNVYRVVENYINYDSDELSN